ncbi:hypothetical protein CEUSTIGMA_g10784.t1 [Chlamydomonas eustigma]|uniref:Uncharacterized protein n=1 Tax=Chlamydomonas eustigma TaxID=1157962 RepID=A0A250XKA0_9CHLO|nr:hypothetical protein CEUSTIGMA_g10784.t1 [Chlamydomonas eustigma]|eukprot:GAX83359.1 hypothetical protein CEUSTIGMA_g10784.t1 [Chlamydomonas eustigma]
MIISNSQLIIAYLRAIWFELFLLAGILGTCFVEDAFERGRYIFLAYLAMASFFLTVSARDFVNNSVSNTQTLSIRNYNTDALYASAAGCIMLGVVNYCMIIFIGLGITTDIPDMAMPGMLAKYGVGGARAQRYEPSSTQGF